ncbi:MAG TPA: hypothetical protein VF230_09785 [Acidimicrobiales bacterium]
MRRLFAATLVAVSVAAAAPATAGNDLNGNGAPSGSHYTLNIIGVPKNKTVPTMTGNNGHRIFVPLSGSSKILLSEGAFSVLDANGTDGTASFQLPKPAEFVQDATTSTSDYSVFARALGKPGGEAVVTTCGYDKVTGERVCDTLNSLTLRRSTGKSSFTNVTRELLYIYADLTDDGVDNPQLYPLFSDALRDYFWQYDNTGLKLAQLRFYPCDTTVDATGEVSSEC